MKAISSIALYSIVALFVVLLLFSGEEDYLMALSIDGFLSVWNLAKKQCVCTQNLQFDGSSE